MKKIGRIGKFLKKTSTWGALGAILLPSVYQASFGAGVGSLKASAAIYTPVDTSTSGFTDPEYPHSSTQTVNSVIGFYELTSASYAALYTLDSTVDDGNLYSTWTDGAWNSSISSWATAHKNWDYAFSYDGAEPSSAFLYQGSLVYCMQEAKGSSIAIPAASIKTNGSGYANALMKVVMWNGFPNQSIAQLNAWTGVKLVSAAQAYGATQYAIWMAANGGTLYSDAKSKSTAGINTNGIIYKTALKIYTMSKATYAANGDSVESYAASLSTSAAKIVSANKAAALSLANASAVTEAAVLASSATISAYNSGAASVKSSLTTIMQSSANSDAASLLAASAVTDLAIAKSAQASASASIASDLKASVTGSIASGNANWNASSENVGLGASSYDTISRSSAAHIFYFNTSATDNVPYGSASGSTYNTSGSVTSGSYTTSAGISTVASKASSASAEMTIHFSSALPAGSIIYADTEANIDNNDLTDAYKATATGSASQTFTFPAGDKVKVVIPFSGTGGTVNLDYSVVAAGSLTTTTNQYAQVSLSSSADYDTGKVAASVAANSYSASYSGRTYQVIKKYFTYAPTYSADQALGVMAIGTSSIASGTVGNTVQSASSEESGVVTTGTVVASEFQSSSLSASFTNSATGSVAPESYSPIWGSPKLLKKDSVTGAALSGAVFDLYTVSGSTSSLVGSYTTDSDGEIDTYDSVKLPYGTTYKWVETKEPARYDSNASDIATLDSQKGTTLTGTIDATHIFDDSTLQTTAYNLYVAPSEDNRMSITSQLMDDQLLTAGYFDVGTSSTFIDRMHFRAVSGSNDTVKATLNVVNSAGTVVSSPVSVTKSFKAPTSAGSAYYDEAGTSYVSSSVDLQFTGLNLSSMLSSAGSGSKLVVTETLTDTDEDTDTGSSLTVAGLGLFDKSETMSLQPSLTTSAASSDSPTSSSSSIYIYNSKNIDDYGTPTDKIRDTVSYSNLTAGKTYIVHGELYDPTTGEAYLDQNGNTVTGSTTFTPSGTAGTAVSGTTTVDYSFDGTNLEQGQKVVSTEYITPTTNTSNVVASEKSMTDTNQMVSMVSPYRLSSGTTDVYTDRLSKGLDFDYSATITKTTKSSLADTLTAAKKYLDESGLDLVVTDDAGDTLYDEPLTSADFESSSANGTIDGTHGRLETFTFMLSGTLNTTAIENDYAKGAKVPLHFALKASTPVTDGSIEYGDSSFDTYGYAASETLIDEDDLTNDVSSTNETPSGSSDDEGGLLKDYTLSLPQVVTKRGDADPTVSDEKYNVSSLKDFEIKSGNGYSEGFQVGYTGYNSWSVGDGSNYFSTSTTSSPLPLTFSVSKGLVSDLDVTDANNEGTSDSSLLSVLSKSNSTGTTWDYARDWTAALLSGSKSTDSDYATREAHVSGRSDMVNSSDIYDTTNDFTAALASGGTISTHQLYTTTYIGKFKTSYLTQDKNAFVDYASKSGSVSGGAQFFIPIWADLSTYSSYVNYGTNSTQRFGQNYVTIDIKRNMDVYAERYLQSEDTNSSSNKYAELSVQPVYNNLTIPGWTSTENQWLNK